MLKKKLLPISFFTILLIAILHYFALKFNWYFNIRWIDIVMHILGGFWVTVTAFWIALSYGYIEKMSGHKLKCFMIMFFSVLVIGIIWEVFELFSHNTYTTSSNYWSDTLWDVSNGFIGGLIAYFYFIQRKKCSFIIKK